jgi:hypothetical protein
VRRELESVLDAVRTLPATDLPAFIGQIAEVHAIALARLTSPIPAAALPDRNLDDVLDVDQAAAYIDMSAKWIYRHQGILPVMKVGFGRKPRLKFRRRDLDTWLEEHRIKHSKHW